MAQISRPAIPAKMYRQFAIITVAVTAVLAVFAQGENAQYAAQQQAASNPRTPQARVPRASSTPRYGTPVMTYDDSLGDQGFDESASGPVAVTRANTGGNSLYINSAEVPAQGSENAGFTRAYLDSLSDEELERLAEEMRRQGMEDPAARAQALRVLEAASRRRSGRATAME